MAKKNWFDTIDDRLSNAKFEFNFPVQNGKELTEKLFPVKKGDPFNLEGIDLHITPFDDFMAGLEGFGFQDKGDHYEMVTNLGGQKGESGTPEDAVKVELTGKDGRTVEITYEHSTSADENCFYSHSQKTSATLPDNADAETVRAYFDENDNVVVSVKKLSFKKTRAIRVDTKRRDR